MKLVVCALSDLEQELARHAPAGVVSLASPDQPIPSIGGDRTRLVLRFNDIAAPRDGLVAADAETVRRLLAFADRFDQDAVLLLHCWMGISRSPAAAFAIACARSPSTPEARIAGALRQASPSATPNPRLVRLADDLLGRGGRMVEAIAGIGRGREAAMGAPFVLELPAPARSP
jgi:predicted protein tyrosine phosphatase